MKLVYLHQYFNFPDSNGGTRSYDLATSFVKKGIDVEIITSTANLKGNFNYGWNLIEKEGLKLYAYKQEYDNNLSYLKRISIFLIFLLKASNKLLSIKTDLVLASSTPLTIGVPALFKKWIDKTPYIFEVRDVWPEAVIAIGAIKNPLLIRGLFFLEKLIYKNAASIVPLSTDMKLSIISRFPFTEKKIQYVIENISEIKRFQSISKNPKAISDYIGFKPRFSILYAGTFGRVNGLIYVLKLAERLISIDRSIIFILIGEGLEKKKIIKEAKRRKIFNKNIYFLDPVSKSELPSLYSSANMGSSFVIPIKELWANSANKFFDALASGKPILINHGGWQKSIIEEVNTGYVLPPILKNKSIHDFVKYSKNTKLQEQQCENAIKKANESYSLPVSVKKYMSIIKSIK